MALIQSPIEPAAEWPGTSGTFRLQLTNEFQLLDGVTPVRLPHSAERVVAFLALSRRPVTRTTLAGTLWPDVSGDRAYGDLRSSLWRLRRVAPIVPASEDRLTLNGDVSVDVIELTEVTHQILDGSSRSALAGLPDLVAGREILPSWDEEWLVIERERYRALRLLALEHAAGLLLEDGNRAGALQVALAAVYTEPLRESAQRLLVQIHLAEGNRAEAARVYRSYRSLMAEELGIEPSSLMEDLAAPLLPARAT